MTPERFREIKKLYDELHEGVNNLVGIVEYMEDASESVKNGESVIYNIQRIIETLDPVDKQEIHELVYRRSVEKRDRLQKKFDNL